MVWRNFPRITEIGLSFHAGDAGEMERALPEAGLLRLNRHHFRLDKGITTRERQKEKCQLPTRKILLVFCLGPSEVVSFYSTNQINLWFVLSYTCAMVDQRMCFRDRQIR